MDWLTFTSKTIESLAWPLATLALVILLKDEIVKLAPFIKRLKAGPVEAEFEREVIQLEKIKESTIKQNGSTATQVEDTASKDVLFQLAELHPRSAILESWVRLEAAARVVLAQSKISSPGAGYIPAARLAEPLAQQGIISAGQVTLFHELRRLRNEVAHAQGFEPTRLSANSYINLASFLQAHLEGHVKSA